MAPSSYCQVQRNSRQLDSKRGYSRNFLRGRLSGGPHWSRSLLANSYRPVPRAQHRGAPRPTCMRGAAHRAIASSSTGAVAQSPAVTKQLSLQRRMPGPVADVPQADAAWALWRKLGSPRYHVAPMVDQVNVLELPGRWRGMQAWRSSGIPQMTACSLQTCGLLDQFDDDADGIYMACIGPSMCWEPAAACVSR